VRPRRHPEHDAAHDRPAGWHQDAAGAYVLDVSDSTVAAPAVTRALVTAGADVLALSEPQHTLEDVYLELVDEAKTAGGS